MSRHVSVAPYARALFEVALQENRVEAIGDELAAIASTVAAHADIATFFGHPAVPAKAKTSVVNRLAEECHASAPLRKLLALLGDRDRLTLLAPLNEAYQQRLLQHQGVVEAHVTTAVPLDVARTEALSRGLERATGRKVRLSTSVDPSILGGVVTRVGSRVFDGSVSRQLDRLKERLSAQ